MLRIIRKTTLDALRSDSAALPVVRDELAHAKTEAERATDSAIRAENVATRQLRDLAQAHADRIKAERDAQQARTKREQDKTETTRQLADLRADLAQLRAAANDPETGDMVQAAIPYGVLRDLYADAWRQGLLPQRPFDVIAAVLGFDFDTVTTQPDAATA